MLLNSYIKLQKMQTTLPQQRRSVVAWPCGNGQGRGGYEDSVEGDRDVHYCDKWYTFMRAYVCQISSSCILKISAVYYVSVIHTARRKQNTTTALIKVLSGNIKITDHQRLSNSMVSKLYSEEFSQGLERDSWDSKHFNLFFFFFLNQKWNHWDSELLNIQLWR